MQKVNKTIYSWHDFFELVWPQIAKRDFFLDAGSGKPFQKAMKKYKPLFRKKYYLSLDFDYQSRPQLVADLHSLPLKKDSVEVVFLQAVLEHVKLPHLIVEEIYRVLKPGGILLLWAPFLYVYHGNKIYKDYFRFTKDGLLNILEMFDKVELYPTRGYIETLINLLPWPGDKLLALPARWFDRLFKIGKEQVSGFGALAMKTKGK